MQASTCTQPARRAWHPRAVRANIGDRRIPTPATRTIAKEVSQENREDHPVVQHLQRQVANAFVLHANYKHYHWQTFGPLFRDLHLMFDEFAKDVLDTTDQMAERIRMIGPDVQSVQFSRTVQIHEKHEWFLRQVLKKKDGLVS